MEGRGFICLLMFSLMLICDLNAMSIHDIPSAQHLDEGRKAELVLGSLFWQNVTSEVYYSHGLQ